MSDYFKLDYSTNKSSPMNHRNDNGPSGGAHNTIPESIVSGRHPHFNHKWTRAISPTSPIFRYPDFSRLQSQPGQKATETLHLRPSVLLADRGRRSVCESESKNGLDFHSPKENSKDIYDSVSNTSPAPIMAYRRPGLCTFSGTEGCSCNVSWYSEPEKEDLQSYHHDNGIASSTQVPQAPANSPHEQLQKVDERYHGQPDPSSQWSNYCKPAVEDEEDDTIKCHVSDMSNGAESDTTFARPQPSGWFGGKLEHENNASPTFIHSNLRNIDEVERCPAVHVALNVDDNSNDSELQFWRQRRQEMLDEIRQMHEGQAQFGQPPAHIASNSLTSRVSEAESMVNLMDQRGFKPTSQWLTEYSSVADLADRGNIYPLMAFVIAEFGEFFQDEEPASKDHHSQELSDLDTVTNKGVIDACRAVKSLISMGSSRPTEAWSKQYDALTTSAQDRGDIKPLIEFVRCEAENISVRNASERAARVKELLRQTYQIINLDEFGTQIRWSLKNGPQIGHDNGRKGQDSGHSHGDFHHEYGIWLTENYQSETTPLGIRFIYVANSMHPIVAGLGDFETKQPFVVTLSHYFDDFRLLASISMVALAVRVTPSKKQHCVDTYAAVWLRDSLYRERFDSPCRIQGFSAQGQPFDLHEEALISMIETRLRNHFEATVPEEVESNRASNSTPNVSSPPFAFGTTLRRCDSDRSQSQSPTSFSQPHIHLTPEETREMHPNVVAEKGMTLVPLHDFPDLPVDQDNFVYYQLSIGEPPSSVFVNCERCHKTMASFENVEVQPTVARREEDEPGDTYTVTSSNSVANIIDSVDRVKRVWLQIGTHKYFMRANEAGVEKTHECNSIQDTLIAMKQDEREAAAGHYTKDNERTGCRRLEEIPPSEPRSHGRQLFLDDLEEVVGYNRLSDISSCDPKQPRDHVRLPQSENHQSKPQPLPSVRMPSSMQYLQLPQNFHEAKMRSLFPCTIISICEQRGIKQGVYQGVIGYGSVFRDPEERGHTVYLDIRDSLGGYIGRLSRVCHYEIRLMNGEVVSLNAEDEVEEMMDQIPLLHQSASASRGQTIGLRGGASPVQYWADANTAAYWLDDEEIELRGGAGGEYSDVDHDATGGEPKEERISTKTITEATVPPPQSPQTALASASQCSDHLPVDWIPKGVCAQKLNQQALSNVGPKQRVRPTALSPNQLKSQQKRCTCSSNKDKNPARAPEVPPGASTTPLMINESDNLSDCVAPSERKETALDLVYEGAPEIVRSHSHQWASSMSHRSSLKDQGLTEALEHFAVASRHQLVPSNDPPQPRLPQDGSERIPSWLQAGPQSGPDQAEGEGPVFSESYKKWLRDMYTRPSYSTCRTNPAPGPSFQDFWKNREGGKPAIMADWSVFRPRTSLESEYHGPSFGEDEYTRMEPDGHVGRNREGQSSFVQSLRSDAIQPDQPDRRWQGMDVHEGEHIRLAEEPPRTEKSTSLNPALQNILNRYLRGRRIPKVKADSNGTVKEG